MNKINLIFLAVSNLALLTACNKDTFLTKNPKNELTEAVVFNSYESVKTYSWQFYDAFTAYDQANTGTFNAGNDNLDGTRSTVQLRTGVNELAMWADFDSDLMDAGSDNGESLWIWQRVVTPTSSYDYSAPYKNIRALNVLINGIENSKSLSQEEKDHWKSVAFFFRAFNHASLMNRYGDIVYVDALLTEKSPELYQAQIPRDEVAAKILTELLWARDHLGTFNDGKNTINQDVIQAFISRFGLMEGTWRKYHNLPDATKYLEASVTASAALLPKYTIHPQYDEVFNSASLANVGGIILYKDYVENVTVHRTTQETRNDNAGEDLTKKAADMYLMTDGQTRWTSPLFENDRDFYAEHRNRDKRFYYTITPPYKVKRNPQNPNGYLPTGVATDMEYFPLMQSLSDPLHKTFPSDQWTGVICLEQPNFFRNRINNFNHTGTGYRCWKFYNRLVTGINNRDITDAPIFRIEETMLNYAEATYELGRFNQQICDQTINKLRTRGGVRSLTIGAEPNDPTRDAAVAATLWEIRRERAIELMAEGFRYDDLRRWKKGAYLAQQKLGRWIKKTDYPNMPILNNANEGYIALDGTPPGFPDYYYLQPIPLNELILNKNLVQNKDWKK